MNLADVLRGVDLSSDIPDVDVSRVEIDSRRCTPGTLFFAMPGHSESGSRYIDDAVLRGAVAVVTATGGTALVPTVLVDDKILGDVLVRACQNVAGHPETSIIPYRLASTDPGEMMPELGRSLTHKEGVALITRSLSSDVASSRPTTHASATAAQAGSVRERCAASSRTSMTSTKPGDGGTAAAAAAAASRTAEQRRRSMADSGSHARQTQTQSDNQSEITGIGFMRG